MSSGNVLRQIRPIRADLRKPGFRSHQSLLSLVPLEMLNLDKKWEAGQGGCEQAGSHDLSFHLDWMKWMEQLCVVNVGRGSGQINVCSVRRLSVRGREGYLDGGLLAVKGSTVLSTAKRTSHEQAVIFSNS